MRFKGINMGLDSTFFEANKRLPFNRLNKHCLGSGTEWDSEYIDKNLSEMYYFRNYHDLHRLVSNIWKNENPEDAKNYSDNGLFIELTPKILKEVVELIYNSEYEESFYPTICLMYVNTTLHNRVYYYEGDY